MVTCRSAADPGCASPATVIAAVLAATGDYIASDVGGAPVFTTHAELPLCVPHADMLTIGVSIAGPGVMHVDVYPIEPNVEATGSRMILVGTPSGAWSDFPPVMAAKLGHVVDVPTLIRHDAGDLMGAPPDDLDYLMCSECGAIRGHTAACSTNAKPIGGAS